MIGDGRYAELIDLIYEAGADRAGWPEALRAVARAHGAPAAVLTSVGSAPDDFWHMSPDVDPAQMDRYAHYYHRIDPLWQVALPAAPGTVLIDAMMVERPVLERTEFFNDFLAPQDFGSMLGSIVHAEDDRRCYVVLQRRRPFDADDIALHGRLAPHLLRAAMLNRRLSAIETRSAAAAEALGRLRVGVILVDAQCRVLFVNGEAERLVRPGGSLRLAAGRLTARAAGDAERLRGLVASCEGRRGDIDAAGGAFALAVSGDGPPISAEVLPLRTEQSFPFVTQRPVAIVFISDRGQVAVPPAQRLQQRYGLTRAEAAFALEIVNGDGVQASANRLGVSRSTARTHLSRIFQKTGANRQAELVRLLAQN
jgi:DNA-binding CsgD family transcriptional regulator